MIDGLPLLVLALVTALTLMAFWRLILMCLAAALLTVFAVGLIEIVTQIGELL